MLAADKHVVALSGHFLNAHTMESSTGPAIMKVGFDRSK
jgi:hypothetical protein